jgi:hypothetical protein
MPSLPATTPSPPPSGAPPSATDIVAPPILVGVPTNVTLTAEDRAVAIGWNLVSGADVYRIEWETDPTPPEDTPGAGAVTHGETAPLANGILYTYTVVREDGSSVVLSAIPSAASGAPTGVSVTPGPDDNTLSWNPVTGATAYRVYWSFTPGVTPFNGTRIDAGAATAYVHAGLESGADYHYVVTAISSTGVESAASAEVGGRPGSTGTVSVTAGDRRVTVSWTDNADPTITYTKSLALYVGSPFFFPYRITGLENGRRYGFRVTPQFTQGAGRPSTRVYATPTASVAGVPQGVTITAGRDENTITWSPVLGAAGYDVSWWSLNAGEPSTGSATVTGTAFRHAGLLTCLAAAPTCPAYSYTVTVSGGSTSSTEVGAVSIPFQPFPPLITNATRVILAGLKPSGTSVALNGAEIVPRNRDTGWEYPVDLLEGLNALAFVAIDDAGRMSAAASYQIMRDTLPPAEPAITAASCVASTVGPPRATFTGTKELDTAIVLIDPANFERLLVGADHVTTWTATMDASSGVVDFPFIAKDIAGNASFQVTATVTCP